MCKARRVDDHYECPRCGHSWDADDDLDRPECLDSQEIAKRTLRAIHELLED